MLSKKIDITNYKLFKSSEIELSNINLLVGKNSSGKSSFLELFRLLSKSLKVLDFESINSTYFDSISSAIKTQLVDDTKEKGGELLETHVTTKRLEVALDVNYRELKEYLHKDDQLRIKLCYDQHPTHRHNAYLSSWQIQFKPHSDYHLSENRKKVIFKSSDWNVIFSTVLVVDENKIQNDQDDHLFVTAHPSNFLHFYRYVNSMLEKANVIIKEGEFYISPTVDFDSDKKHAFSLSRIKKNLKKDFYKISDYLIQGVNDESRPNAWTVTLKWLLKKHIEANKIDYELDSGGLYGEIEQVDKKGYLSTNDDGVIDYKDTKTTELACEVKKYRTSKLFFNYTMLPLSFLKNLFDQLQVWEEVIIDYHANSASVGHDSFLVRNNQVIHKEQAAKEIKKLVFERLYPDTKYSKVNEKISGWEAESDRIRQESNESETKFLIHSFQEAQDFLSCFRVVISSNETLKNALKKGIITKAKSWVSVFIKYDINPEYRVLLNILYLMVTCDYGIFDAQSAEMRESWIQTFKKLQKGSLYKKLTRPIGYDGMVSTNYTPKNILTSSITQILNQVSGVPKDFAKKQEQLISQMQEFEMNLDLSTPQEYEICTSFSDLETDDFRYHPFGGSLGRGFVLPDYENPTTNEFFILNTGLSEGGKLMKKSFLDPFCSMIETMERKNTQQYCHLDLTSKTIIKQRFFNIYLSKNSVELSFFEFWLNEFCGKKHSEKATFIRDCVNQELKIKNFKGEYRSYKEEGVGLQKILFLLTEIVLLAYQNRIFTTARSEEIDLTGVCAYKKGVLTLSEPESNIHPDFQSKMIDLIVDTACRFNIQFLIESHSEYFIRRLQYWTIKKKLHKGDVVINYFDNKKGASISPIYINKDGGCSRDFGTGFIDQTPRDLREIMELKAKLN